MSALPNEQSSSPALVATLVLHPLDEDDLETLSLLEDTREALWRDLTHIPGYRVSISEGDTRDGGLILLIAETARQVVAYKDLVMGLFETCRTAITALAKQGHVTKIELTIDGDSIRLEDVDRLTTQRLIDIFEAKHPGKTAQISASSSPTIVGTISTKAS
jgi:hypothetical protein